MPQPARTRSATSSTDVPSTAPSGPQHGRSRSPPNPQRSSTAQQGVGGRQRPRSPDYPPPPQQRRMPERRPEDDDPWSVPTEQRASRSSDPTTANAAGAAPGRTASSATTGEAEGTSSRCSGPTTGDSWSLPARWGTAVFKDEPYWIEQTFGQLLSAIEEELELMTDDVSVEAHKKFGSCLLSLRTSWNKVSQQTPLTCKWVLWAQSLWSLCRRWRRSVSRRSSVG